MDILLAAVVALAAVAGWTAWESSMAARLRRDRRPLVARNAAVAGAHRLSVVAHLGLVGLAVALAALVQVPLWWSPVAVATPSLGAVVTGALLLVAGGCVGWAARRNRLPRDRRALLAVVATAVATEVLLRGLLLGLLDAAGWPVTAAVLVAAVATGLLQAWRAGPGSRTFGLVLATVLGFALGLVVVLVGSVLAAVAIHVVVATLGLVRTVPGAGHTAGCGCGGHDHDATGTATFTTVPGDPATPVPGGTAGTAAGGHDHTTCGSTCDHAGTSACASCPLSKARV
ncbi:CPBP family glutamic-type intramembrane protease [Aquipuribacter sp. MA13-6]|uniref:CPBP family glutamic-type intramembrane protease n=1 Tax=unclassified Aquipuribacter TaxID=2635084 RepID=UPI003EEB8D8A